MCARWKLIVAGMTCTLAAWPLMVGCSKENQQSSKTAAAKKPGIDEAIAMGPESSAIPPVLDKGWCAGHGVPESVCTRCNSSLIPQFKEAGDWCEEHGLPETQCTKCHPEVAARWGLLNPDREDSDAPKQDAPASKPSAAAPAPPGPALRNGTARRAALPPSPTCTNSKTLVNLQSADVVRTAGLEFAEITEQPLSVTITRNAEVTYNANRYARLSPRAAGVIADVLRDLGDAVAAGDVLAVVDSAELGSAKAEYLQALASTQLWKQAAERERSLASRGIGAEREALEAENKLAEGQITLATARQRLRNLGLSDADIDSIAQSRDTSSRLQLAAPFDGIVVERSAVLGEVVDTAKVVFVVANTRTMWAMIDLFEVDVPSVAVGQDVVFAPESAPGRAFQGKITWISAHLDPATRTLKARAEITNQSGLLRANTFGRAQIFVRRGESALFVPKEAVQWDGCCNLVFVKRNKEGTSFQPRQVQLGTDTGAGYEVLSGVKTGEVLVTAGSYLLKTEVLKGSIGAGCCDHVEKLAK